MGEYAEYAMMGCYRANGARAPFYPKGYNSEKRDCPLCSKGVAGRDEGMMDHLKMTHKIKSRDDRRQIVKDVPDPKIQLEYKTGEWVGVD